MSTPRTRRSERLHVLISLNEKRDLARLALERDATVSQIIRRALRRELALRGDGRSE